MLRSVCRASRLARTALGGTLALGLATSGSAVAASPAAMNPKTGAKVAIIAPTPGQVVTGQSVAVTSSITHFKLDCALAGKANTMGMGHYHVVLDGALINMACAHAVRVSLANVKPGSHTIEIVPAENDHAEDMSAAGKVTFTYRPSGIPVVIKATSFTGKPSIAITSPKNGTSVHGGFDMTVAPKNFDLSCALYGKPDVAGYGHWHANIDSASGPMMGMMTMLGMSCARTFHVSLAAVKPGPHRFFAVLVDNLHAPTIGAGANILVNVK